MLTEDAHDSRPSEHAQEGHRTDVARLLFLRTPPGLAMHSHKGHSHKTVQLQVLHDLLTITSTTYHRWPAKQLPLLPLHALATSTGHSLLQQLQQKGTQYLLKCSTSNRHTPPCTS